MSNKISKFKFSFNESLYFPKSKIQSAVFKLPTRSYLAPARRGDESTLDKIFPGLDLDKSMAWQLMPVIRGNPNVLSPVGYKKALKSSLDSFEKAEDSDFKEIIDLLKDEMDKQELFSLYQNMLFNA